MEIILTSNGRLLERGLKKLGVLTKFKKAYKKENERDFNFLTYTGDVDVQAIHWVDTLEGYEYWLKINNKLLKL